MPGWKNVVRPAACHVEPAVNSLCAKTPSTTQYPAMTAQLVRSAGARQGLGGCAACKISLSPTVKQTGQESGVNCAEYCHV